MRHPTWLLAVAPLALGAGACWVPDYHHEETETRSWLAIGIEHVDVSTVNGMVSYVGDGTSRVSARITRAATGTDAGDAERALDRIIVYEDVKNGTLSLVADMPSGTMRSYRADFELTGPPDLDVALYTNNGDLLATNMDGAVTMGATNGDLVAHSLRGPVDAWTTNGGIEIGTTELAPYGVLAATTNGDVLVWMDDHDGASFDLRTTNGYARVRNLYNVHLTVDTSRHKAGTINGGGPKVLLSSTNGHVTLSGY